MLEIRECGGSTMAVPLLLLCCFSALTCVSSVVFQSPEIVWAVMNGSFTLNCTSETEMEFCYNSISWFKLQHRTGNLTAARNTGTDQHVNNKRSCVMTFTDAQLDDSGVYYCASVHNKMLIMGNGTRVVITDGAPLKPSVFLYTPLEEADAPSVLLQCLVMDVVPSQVSVWWTVDGERRAGWTESGWTRDDDSAEEYTRAQIVVSTEDLRNVACVVTYANHTLSKTLQPPGDSHATCRWLLFGGCVISFITVAVVITVTLCLCKEKTTATFPVKSQRSGVEPQRRHPAQGKQRNLANCNENHIGLVEYSCLNHELFKHKPNPAATEINNQ